MPEISSFYGINVHMYKESGGKHNLPHIHVDCSGQEVVVDLDGNVLEGSIPRKKMKLLEEWMSLHIEELFDNWNLLAAGEKFFKIEPLK